MQSVLKIQSMSNSSSSTLCKTKAKCVWIFPKKIGRHDIWYDNVSFNQTIFYIGPSNINYIKVARGDFMLYSLRLSCKIKIFELSYQIITMNNIWSYSQFFFSWSFSVTAKF